MVVGGIKHHLLEEVECILCNIVLFFSFHSCIVFDDFLVVTINIHIYVTINILYL